MEIHWKKTKEGLCCSLLFSDFSAAMAFMQEAAELSEQMNHHPDWRNCYRRLDICLSTHDQGNQITEKDLALSAEFNRILSLYEVKNL